MKQLRVLGVFALTMISLNAILNLRSLPAMASLGPQAMVYFALAALLFLIPSALVCAELATAIPKNGGIYTWVRTAFGDKTGFVAIWMEWINNVIGFPTSLAAIAATIAYVGFPSLAHNKYALFAMVLVILWGCTAYNALGIKASSRLNIVGALLGTIVPGLLIIGLGAYWLITHPSAYHALAAEPIMPAWQLGSLAIFVSTLSAYSGMQITAYHAQNVVDPQRAFPKAIGLSAVLVVGLSIVATLAINAVLPSANINFMNGVIQSFGLFFQYFHLQWLTPILALLLALGSIASLSAWLVGPARGFRAACEEHHALRALAPVNRFGMPGRILWVQGIVCTGLAAIFLWMPSLKSAFWVLLTLTSQFTVLMYILVFSAAVVLRYREPQLQRAFRIPGGKPGIIVVCGAGIITCLCGFLLGLFPPHAIGIHNHWHYALFILVGDGIILAIPLVIIRHLRAQSSPSG